MLIATVRAHNGMAVGTEPLTRRIRTLPVITLVVLAQLDRVALVPEYGNGHAQELSDCVLYSVPVIVHNLDVFIIQLLPINDAEPDVDHAPQLLVGAVSQFAPV